MLELARRRSRRGREPEKFAPRPPPTPAMWYAGDAETEAALLGTPTHNELLAAPSSRELYDDLSEGIAKQKEVIERVGRDRAACEAEMDQCDRNIKALQEQLDQQHTLRAKQQGLMQAHGTRARLNQRQLHELAKRRSGVLWQLRPPREVAPVWLRHLSLRDVVLVVRADEAHHRDVNHGFANELAGLPVGQVAECPPHVTLEPNWKKAA